MTANEVTTYKEKFMKEGTDFLFGTIDDTEIGLSYDCEFTKRNANQLVVGRAGTGKSYNYIVPNLRRKICSAVVLDSYMALADEEQRYKNEGVKTHRLNLCDPKHSSRYNPFVHFNIGVSTEEEISIITDHTIRLLAPSVAEDKMFGDPLHMSLEERLMRMVMYYVMTTEELKREEKTFKTLAEIFRNNNELSDFQKFETEKYTRNILEPYTCVQFEKALNKVRSYFEIVSSPAFDCFTELENTDNISVEEMTSELTYLFVTERKDKLTFGTELVNFFINCFNVILFHYIEENLIFAKSNKKLLHVHFYLDELDEYSFSDLEVYMGLCSQYNISYSVLTQGALLVLKDIVEKCNTKIILGTGKRLTKILSTLLSIISPFTSEQLADIISDNNNMVVCVKNSTPMICKKLDPEKYI